MSELELQMGNGLDSVAAQVAEVQQGHMFGIGAVVVPVVGPVTVSLQDYEAVEEFVPVIDCR